MRYIILLLLLLSIQGHYLARGCGLRPRFVGVPFAAGSGALSASLGLGGAIDFSRNSLSVSPGRNLTLLTVWVCSCRVLPCQLHLHLALLMHVLEVLHVLHVLHLSHLLQTMHLLHLPNLLLLHLLLHLLLLLW